MSKSKEWEIGGHCTKCGCPILVRGLDREDPEIKRTCLCLVLALASAPPIVAPTIYTSHDPECDIVKAQSGGWWSVVPPTCTCRQQYINISPSGGYGTDG